MVQAMLSQSDDRLTRKVSTQSPFSQFGRLAYFSYLFSVPGSYIGSLKYFYRVSCVSGLRKVLAYSTTKDQNGAEKLQLPDENWEVSKVLLLVSHENMNSLSLLGTRLMLTPGQENFLRSHALVFSVAASIDHFLNQGSY